MDVSTAGVRLADTADTALFLLGVVAVLWLCARLPDWWEQRVVPWMIDHRFGLRFDLIDEDETK